MVRSARPGVSLAPDRSMAPAPKKADAVPQKPIMAFGDSMADWLAYGPEQAFRDTPEIGIHST